MKPPRPRRVTRIVTGVDDDGEPFADVVYLRPAEWVEGRHFTQYLPEIRAARARRDYAEATRLLELVVPVALTVRPPAPWYVEALAIEYRRAGRHEDERALLARYVEAAQSAGGAGPRHEALVRRWEGMEKPRR